MRDPLPLRDRLAINRTALAMERTWLAHARTALALFVTGASFLQFFEVPGSWTAGLLFIGISVPVLLRGLVQYRHRRKRLDEETAVAAREARPSEGASG